MRTNPQYLQQYSIQSLERDYKHYYFIIRGSEETIPADLVLIAAGFTGAEDYVIDAFQVKTSGRGTVEDQDFAASVPRVFVAGDMRRGQSLVVWAIREGREVAREIDRSLMGYTNLS